ncbi:hypothetical protein HGRIS_007475 [Hohenbuehelia grisea]|uniref:DUF4246 domain-containing protein n=1 Tax=Hohenbuehelia grisea TaxID=104357 RepID=A0ABR3J5C6_9AGAR
MKWADEAQLFGEDSEDEDKALVAQAISDLKAEARRILELDCKVHLTSRNIPAQAIDFRSIGVDVENAVKFARNAQYAIFTPKLQEDIGVFVSDGLVPKSLHKELVRQLDLLASYEPKDFHPGSNCKVLDLIHPSLYPFVAGWTEVTDETRMPEPPDNLLQSTLSAMRDYDFESRYGWLPSTFRMSEDGQNVQIHSYINGLGPRERFPDLYRVIEQVFLIALPHLERTLNFEYEYELTPAQKRWEKRCEARTSASDSRGYIEKEEWQKILIAHQAVKAEEEEQARKLDEQRLDTKAEEIRNTSEIRAAGLSPSIWKGMDLKVIVKAANYILMPGDKYEGSWHMEGMEESLFGCVSHERIVASAIYYYDTDPEVQDEGLGFRRLRDPEEDFPGREEYRHDDFVVPIKPQEDAGKGLNPDMYT